MIPDLDIWRCAQLMINNHGDDAALEAAATADEWLSKGETSKHSACGCGLRRRLMNCNVCGMEKPNTE
jgi:hypothetical protein